VEGMHLSLFHPFATVGHRIRAGPFLKKKKKKKRRRKKERKEEEE